MKITARNQLPGTITELDIGPVTARVTLATSGGIAITAAMTAAAAARLKLQKGQPAVAIVKASNIMLVTDFDGYVLSARNQLAGTISRIEKGAVTSLVALALAGGEQLTASITNDAAASLQLAVGQPATAVFKAYAVMLAVRAT